MYVPVDFNKKIETALQVLKDNEPEEGYYVCFSGGKDSCVAYDLVKRAGVKHEVAHSYIDIEPPVLHTFISQEYPEVKIEYPALNMRELIIKNGIPPLRQMRYCHRALKTGGAGKLKILGIRNSEGTSRANRQLFETIQDGSNALNIIIDWTEQEVWKYIHRFNVPYCNLYDSGRKRIGCLFCPFQSYKQMQKDLVDFPEIADYLIVSCQMAINRRVERGKCIGKYKTGYEMFFNWIAGGRDKEQDQKVAELEAIFHSIKR